MHNHLEYLFKILTFIKGGHFLAFREYCPNCTKKRFFIKPGREAYLTKCLICRSSQICLSLLKTIKADENRIKLQKTYELSFHDIIYNYLKKNYSSFYFSEFFSFSKSKFVNGVRNEDIQKFTFKNSFFNLVTCTEVLEHVPNYKKALKEVFRVLNAGGYFIFTVPLFSSSITRQGAYIDVNNNIRWLMDPEFHGSRITGPNSVPVFWRHSEKQILLDLKNAGFSKAHLKSFFWNKNIRQKVIIAVK
jgi:hypothetical protein